MLTNWNEIDETVLKKPDILSVRAIEIPTNILLIQTHRNDDIYNREDIGNFMYNLNAITDTGERPLYVNLTLDQLAEKLQYVAKKLTGI